MNGPSPVFWVVLIGGLAFGLFQIKHAVQELEGELVALNRDLLASEQSNHVLRAEWAYLNQPSRLAELAGRHLDLEPMAPAQVGGIEALPFRVIDDGASPARSHALLAATGNAP